MAHWLTSCFGHIIGHTNDLPTRRQCAFQIDMCARLYSAFLESMLPVSSLVHSTTTFNDCLGKPGLLLKHGRMEQRRILIIDEKQWGNVTWTDAEDQYGELEGIELAKSTQVSQTGGLSRLRDRALAGMMRGITGKKRWHERWQRDRPRRLPVHHRLKTG
jgi:hypothetical protein